MRFWKPALAFVVGVVPIAMWWFVLAYSKLGVNFGLGSLNFPTRITASIFATFMLIAVVSAPLWRITFEAFTLAPGSRLARDLETLTESRWVALLSFGAFAVAALVRGWVLRGAPLTDDESAYQFAASLLTEGRLWAESAPPEIRLFFDTVFIINDGKMYAQYPLGWPALLAVGMVTGLTPVLNPLLSAATVPAVYGLGRHFAGPREGRIAGGLFIVSPMVATAAATLMSHTAALAAITWAFWVVATRAEVKSPRWDALLAFFIGAAVLIRPGVGVGFGAPLVAWWLYVRAFRTGEGRVVRLASFAVVGSVLGALFFFINHEQTGSMWKLAYTRSLEYAQENGYRFSAWSSPQKFMGGGGFYELTQVALAALLRINQDFFGLPLSLLPLAAVAWSRRLMVLAVPCAAFTFFHFFAADVGVDTFAPVHFFELAGPLTVLIALGVGRWVDRGLGALVMAVLATAWATVIPMRFWSIHLMAQDIIAPLELVEEKDLHEAVVFNVGLPLQCLDLSHHFVFMRPFNHPDLADDVVWVNHLSVQLDRELARRAFPGRAAYLLVQRIDCTLELMPLDAPEAERLAPPYPFINKPK
ncbi:MAG: hypothetical protein DI536_30195 [Archangium gephyra]|uniref:Glycosyltransferase RgtA/B/C/D-like domain-containing protein n=1 Tax=Archangium gephyra TaxID=48 RepID=A0A2W5UBL4_9BACT|nr:MAG: hypothetical protein DI536_30195 [Archangium gephyra]